MPLLCIVNSRTALSSHPGRDWTRWGLPFSMVKFELHPHPAASQVHLASLFTRFAGGIRKLEGKRRLIGTDIRLGQSKIRKVTACIRSGIDFFIREDDHPVSGDIHLAAFANIPVRNHEI